MHSLLYAMIDTDTAPEVRDIRIMDLRNGEITLNWTTIPTCARPVLYNVTSNCSTCSPIAANSTTASCLLPQQWTDVLKCGFSVQSTICDGNLIEMSNAFVVTLQGILFCVYQGSPQLFQASW